MTDPSRPDPASFGSISPSVETRVAALDASVAWGLMATLDPKYAERLSRVDPHEGPLDEDTCEDLCRCRLVDLLLDADPQQAHGLLEIAEFEQRRRVQARAASAARAREEIERVAQSREETVPWWLYEEGMEVW